MPANENMTHKEIKSTEHMHIARILVGDSSSYVTMEYLAAYN